MYISDRRFKILSLDGGGIRGLLTLHILKKVESILDDLHNTNKPLSDYFHMISGTSTGAIIAALLCEGRRVDDISDLYIKLIPKIFGKKSVFPWLKTKYDSKVLQDEAKNIWESRTLGDLTNDLLVPAVNLANPKVDIFSTLNNRGSKIADVVCASASAPSYFKPSTFDHSTYGYIDGGLAANNPTLLALITYLEYKEDSSYKRYSSALPHSIENTVILSLGTGIESMLEYDPGKLTKTGLGGTFTWAKPSIQILFENQTYLVEYQVRKLMKSANNEHSYLRINPILRENIKLDDYKKTEMLKHFLKDEDIDRNFIERYFS